MEEITEKDFELSDKLSQTINNAITAFLKDCQDNDNTGKIINLALAKILSWNAYYFVDEGAPEYALRDIDEIAEAAKTITLGIMEHDAQCENCDCHNNEDDEIPPGTLN